MRVILGLSLIGAALLLPACGSSSSSAGGGGIPLAPAPQGNALLSNAAGGARSASDGAGGAYIVSQTFEASAVRSSLWRVSAGGLILWGPLPLTTAAASLGEMFPEIASDGAGGALVSWSEFRNGAGSQLYAQRFNAFGGRLWGPEGIAAGPTPQYQVRSRIVPDGSGGAIVAWHEHRNLAISGVQVYAQRLTSDGTRLWGAQGLATGIGDRHGFEYDTPLWTLAPDGAGGAFFAWSSDVGARLWQQRVEAGGTLPWGAAGKQVAGRTVPVHKISLTARTGGTFAASWTEFSGSLPGVWIQLFDSTGEVFGPALQLSGSLAADYSLSTSDGAGGVIVAYQRGTDVIVQRVSEIGQVLWGTDGALVGQASDDQIPRDVQALPGGGAVVLWQDFRSLYDHDLYAGRVDAGGTPEWPTSGIPIAIQPYEAHTPSAVALSGGAVLAVWTDARGGPGTSGVYVQILSPSAEGTPPLHPTRIEGPWHSRNVPAAIAPNAEGIQVAEDGLGGMLVLWNDAAFGHVDLRLQRLDAHSAPLWGPSGALIRELADTDDEFREPRVIPDGVGGAYVLWNRLNTDGYDVVGQRVDASGARLWPSSGLSLLSNSSLDEHVLAAVLDGAGGLIVVYLEDSSVLRARRFDSAGEPVWPSPVELVPAPGPFQVRALRDGSGGVFVFWIDRRDATTDLYGQRLNADGLPLWTPGGSGVETPEDENLWDVAPDGAGALLGFGDLDADRAGVRKVDSNGVWTWTSNPMPLPVPGARQAFPRVLSDGTGGAFVLCEESDFVSPIHLNVHARLRRFDAAGSLLWDDRLSSGNEYQTPGALAADGDGGVYVAWAESSQVFARRYDAAGTRLWTPETGLALSSAWGDREHVRGVRGTAGFITAWRDRRRGRLALYAQTVPPDGQP